jgi:hypothetical protein
MSAQLVPRVLGAEYDDPNTACFVLGTAAQCLVLRVENRYFVLRTQNWPPATKRRAMQFANVHFQCGKRVRAVSTWFFKRYRLIDEFRASYFAPGDQIPGMPTNPGKDLMRPIQLRTLG